MKWMYLLIFGIFICSSLFSQSFSKRELVSGYKIEKDTIIFIFSTYEYPKEYSSKREDYIYRKYYVSGSFNNWSLESKEWQLESLRPHLWILKKNLKDIPKNSGFKFTNGKEFMEPDWKKIPLSLLGKFTRKDSKSEKEYSENALLIKE